ncbi:nucleotide-binding domain-containing protein [Suhomyces tanzawaensis NRRL Y-17324]|uniref:Nucleotide-binding domain-containing protein n=1 Tax=Suhomyces tanzawaensis NRRL Y-17324 TaxID=984487 RepID=A0A1E4SM59_9ASCO|nr:nucleotide-binding domain-containing protein [Suhomyces tanzawaensis NRRL Y-17324]ODV80614.1 nucleotide-binding domain-containing protein [Suhomyces tanzawaensis NRRL Y-17324]
MSNVIVLGAGVCGLTAALELKKAQPHLSITILSHKLPGDIDPEYTSPFAGANWHSFASHQEIELQELDKVGYREFQRLAQDVPEAAVTAVNDYDYFSQADVDQANHPKDLLPWFKDFVDGFRVLDPQELPPGIAFGYVFKGVVITVPLYLNWLVQQNLKLGNQLRRTRKFGSLQEVKDLGADIVINSTGLLAPQLVDLNDSRKNYPVRGQTLLVTNSAANSIAVSSFEGYPNEMLYIMPRKEGGSIIGGCFEESSDTSASEAFTERLLERAARFAPELVDPSFKNNSSRFDVVRVNVGLRPFRDSGVRVEADPHRLWLIHNYGAGGGGYQGSYGFSQRVVELVQRKTSARL